MSVANVREEFIKSAFNTPQFVEDCHKLKTMSGGTNAAVDEESLKRVFNVCLQFAEDALEQKTISFQAQNELIDYFFDLLEIQDPLAEQIMGIACDHYLKETEYLKETVSPL